MNLFKIIKNKLKKKCCKNPDIHYGNYIDTYEILYNHIKKYYKYIESINTSGLITIYFYNNNRAYYYKEFFYSERSRACLSCNTCLYNPKEKVINEFKEWFKEEKKKRDYSCIVDDICGCGEK